MNLRQIQNQVKLPINIALQVVMQGIRIRFGRSLVTMSGVALGIAFLMSIFTGQVARKGVAAEEGVRQELGRMANFLVAEVGPLKGRTIGVLQVGPLSSLERRFLDTLRAEGVSSLLWATRGAGTAPPNTPIIRQESIDSIGADVSGVLVIGESTAEPIEVNWTAILADAKQRVVAVTSLDVQVKAPQAGRLVNLARKPNPEEIAKAQANARKEGFRNLWIIIISLLVTVIGISNAMLMSVTERFREIGTMKCLGALSAFIRQIFLIESSLVGLAGSIAGAVFGTAFSLVAYSLTYGPSLVLGSMAWLTLGGLLLLSLGIGVVLSIVAALYPASFASRMVPATALRSNI